MTELEESKTHQGDETDEPSSAPDEHSTDAEHGEASTPNAHSGEPGAGGARGEDPRPAEAFKQGLGLLWQAARSTADEIRREVDKGRVGEALQQAGRELERAATQASGVVEQLIGKVRPPDPKTEPWPNSPAKRPETEQVDDDTPSDGGTAEDGERRDMRIQIDPDDKE